MQETARSNSRALSRTGSPRLGDRVKPGSVLSLFLPKNMPICFSEALNGLEPKALAPCIVGFSLLRLTAAFLVFLPLDARSIEMRVNTLTVHTSTKFALVRRYSSVSLSSGFVRMSAAISLVAHHVIYSIDSKLPACMLLLQLPWHSQIGIALVHNGTCTDR